MAPDTTRLRPGRLVAIAALALWSAASVVGFAMLIGYTQTPGALQHPPREKLDLGWHPSAPYRLVVAIHPQCTCSRATASELARILRDHSNLLACKILMYQPAGAPNTFGETWLMERLAELPNTIIDVDVDGQQASSLGMRTSGSVVLYDFAGNQQFYGGITVARGHEGNSVGAESILSIIQNSPPATTCTEVYGCPLQQAAKNDPLRD